MQWSKIRKALIAGAGAFIAGVVAAIVKAEGMPGWPAVGTAALAAAAAGWAAWRVPNARSTPGVQ